jgi:hypothetical protein
MGSEVQVGRAESVADERPGRAVGGERVVNVPVDACARVRGTLITALVANVPRQGRKCSRGTFHTATARVAPHQAQE